VEAVGEEAQEVGVPGKQIKSWKTYHALRRKGASKTKAAKIANSRGRRKKGRRRKRR